ncbi:MAG: insulinase family protein [Acidobacteria bacterium]|nr:insulinase family protein [Acidobacteriota bacterium]
MKHTGRIFIALLWCLSLAASAAQERSVRVHFKETTLKNGLRVITVEDRNAPVIAIAVTYNVGSRDEKKGRTGFAHLFEHMMFKGSENVGPGEHFVLISNNGGELNGTTSEDRTNYFEALPSNQLDLALFLEADRMRSLEITEENLDNQRNAVQEERRLRVDNRPYGRSDEVMQETLYDNFAYQHSVLGSMEDLDAAAVEEVRQFFKIYYAPNNAVLTLVGDFRTDDVIRKIRKYFESIPRQPDPLPVDASEPEQTAERRATVQDPLARLSQVEIAFKTVPGNTSDFYALQVLSAALQSGQSSRLYQKLVKEKELATSVDGSVSERRGSGALYISVMLRPGKQATDVEAVIYEEIERLKREAIAEWELQKAKNSTRRRFISNIQSSMARAIMIGQYAVFYNDPDLINARLDKVRAVTKEDVRRAANRYLQATNRTIVITLPQARDVSMSNGESQMFNMSLKFLDPPGLLFFVPRVIGHSSS